MQIWYLDKLILSVITAVNIIPTMSLNGCSYLEVNNKLSKRKFDKKDTIL